MNQKVGRIQQAVVWLGVASLGLLPLSPLSAQEPKLRATLKGHTSGRLFLLCFSDEEPGRQGPRRVSKKERHAAFAGGWSVESIKASRYEVRPDLKDLTFSESGPKALFVLVTECGRRGRSFLWPGRFSVVEGQDESRWTNRRTDLLPVSLS